MCGLLGFITLLWSRESTPSGLLARVPRSGHRTKRRIQDMAANDHGKLRRRVAEWRHRARHRGLQPEPADRREVPPPLLLVGGSDGLEHSRLPQVAFHSDAGTATFRIVDVVRVEVLAEKREH